MNLNIKAMAIAFGGVLGISLFVITWWIIFLEGPLPDYNPFIGKFYIGYSLTPTGSIIGLLWGLADGAIGGAIFGWLYNRFNS